MEDVKDLIRSGPRAEDRLEKRLKDLEALKDEMTIKIAEANGLIGKTLELVDRTNTLLEGLQAAMKRLITVIEAEARESERERIELLSGYR